MMNPQRKMTWKSFILLTAVLFWSGRLFPLEKNDNTNSAGSTGLTVERIFSTDEFKEKSFGPANWLEHKSGYTMLESSKTLKNGKDIVSYDPRSGKRRVEVAAEQLVPAGQSAPLDIENYYWSPDGKWLMIFTNSKRVWRQKTRGDYWVLKLISKGKKTKTDWPKPWKLGGDVEESTLMFAKFSPDGTRVGYVHKNNLYIQYLADKTADRHIVQLTEDGSETIINGTFDWVYEEEFHMRDGFRWSPDGKYIAYWQLDAEGVGVFNLVNYTDSLYSKIIPVQYPKAGTTNSACKVGVVPVAGGETRWFDLPGDSRNHYIARMSWAANSKEIVFQRLNRKQNTNYLMLGNILTGEARSILTDRDDAWVEVVNDLKWMDRGNHFTWVSERDGWRHVYVVSRSGKDMRLVTPGEYDVIRILKIDTRRGWMYYMASPENSVQKYLYRIRLKGKSKPQRLSPLNMPGTHSYTLSPDLKWAFHTYSNFSTPPKTTLVRLPSHKPVRVLEGNETLRAAVAGIKRLPEEFFRVDIGGGVALDAYCMKPPDFDASRRYPVLFYVYGEPWSQTVLDKWSRKRFLWHTMLTEQGYIVMSVDNRGTPSPRGREWRKCVYRQIGIQASADQAAAVRAILKNRPYIDPERVGVWGWSGGGSMTLNAMFRYPELYKTGIAVAPVPDMRLYDTIYQERYMDLPKDNPEGYEKGSPITFAERLKGNLLIVHGTGDDNVHYQGTARLINKLIRFNKQFSMMAYPNRGHSIYEGENTTRHLYELLTRYLKQNLKPGGR